MTKLEWKGEDDDFTAVYGDYCLRAEMMSKKRWWWCVYFKHYDSFANANDDGFAATKQEAKLIAEVQFLRHYINEAAKSPKKQEERV